MKRLSDELLIESYNKAKELNLSSEFIHLIEIGITAAIIHIQTEMSFARLYYNSGGAFLIICLGSRKLKYRKAPDYCAFSTTVRLYIQLIVPNACTHF